MRLVLVAGFLGSGKTTLLEHIARQLTAAGRKIAIIENEAGEIGIDGNYLRQNGLEVQELYGGCICCTLSVDLVVTLPEDLRQRIEWGDTFLQEITTQGKVLYESADA